MLFTIGSQLHVWICRSFFFVVSDLSCFDNSRTNYVRLAVSASTPKPEGITALVYVCKCLLLLVKLKTIKIEIYDLTGCLGHDKKVLRNHNRRWRGRPFSRDDTWLRPSVHDARWLFLRLFVIESAENICFFLNWVFSYIHNSAFRFLVTIFYKFILYTPNTA
jgi:hypothetical protein